MGKDAIIEKILADAKLRADAVIGEAEDKADAILALAADQCKSYYSSAKSQTDKAVADILARGEAVAELDAKKLILKAKSEALNSVFALALEKARKLDKARYKKLIANMLMKAEDGDTVTYSAREKGIVTEKLLADIAAKKGIKLKLGGLGDFNGGIVLSGKGVDKNLTLEVEIAMLKDAAEAQIAKEMFD